MTAEQVRKAQQAVPFRPFVIYLSDQRRFEIKHPDFVWLLPGGRNVAVADSDGTLELIDLIHVSSLKLQESENH